jgi:hypothetical protein
MKMDRAELESMPVTLDDAIERAAQHLPEGWLISIHVENGGYDVELKGPNDTDASSIDGGDGIRSDINEAICIANGFTG